MKQTITTVLGVFAFAAVWATPLGAQDAMHSSMVVYKSPNCGCCGSWVKIMKDAGFTVTVRDTEDMESVKKLAGIPGDHQACHTAKIGGYVVEGHVPASTIKRMLSAKPDIHGIAVPGMPFGSPGMGHDPNARYSVMTLEKDGTKPSRVYEQIGAE